MLQSRFVVSNSLISRKYALSTKQSSYETRQVVTYHVTILILGKKIKKVKEEIERGLGMSAISKAPKSLFYHSAG